MVRFYHVMRMKSCFSLLLCPVFDDTYGVSCEYDVEGTGRKREATALVCTLQAQRRHLHTLSWWDLNVNFVVLTYQTKAGECPGDIEDVNGVTCVM